VALSCSASGALFLMEFLKYGSARHRSCAEVVNNSRTQYSHAIKCNLAAREIGAAACILGEKFTSPLLYMQLCDFCVAENDQQSSILQSQMLRFTLVGKYFRYFI